MTTPYTKEEARQHILAHMRTMARYWARVENGGSVEDRIDGFAFSMLVMFDGSSAELPAMNIALAPHPEDKAYQQGQGERWYEPGTVINDDCHLHELWHQRKAPTTTN